MNSTKSRYGRVLAAVLLGAVGATPSCANSLDLGLPSDSADAGTSLGIVAPPSADGGEDDASDASNAIAMCPTSACPALTATCSTSTYRCDVDLLTDPANCGSCDNPCRDLPNIFARESCVSGLCTMQCAAKHADCDGLPDNGCETDITERQNCGGCGVACEDGVPCVPWGTSSNAPRACGCPPPTTNCAGECLDLRGDVDNCGECGNVCRVPPESPLGSTAICADGICKVATLIDGADELCPSGDPPKIDRPTSRLYCECPAGFADCSRDPAYFECVNLVVDEAHCGGCGRVCADAPSGFGTCIDGECELLCVGGTHDCNGWIEDGCEVNVKSDPSNCGACGNACDVAAGQPCVDGVCVTTPCEVAR